MPWKNGGGDTTEIVVHPPGADFESFDWRVSMARVASNGPFSRFPDVDRTLVLLEGSPMELTFPSTSAILSRTSTPFSFPADLATSATLTEGPITDLNVMTRRGRFIHSVSDINLTEPVDLGAGPHARLIFCREGAVQANDVVLSRFDAMLVEEADPCRLRPLEKARVVAISIQAV